jgi:uncharacterized protein (UPF0548 family)
MSGAVYTTAPMGRRARRQLRDLSDRSLNFAVEELPTDEESPGWHIDDHCQPLPAEPPGPPVEGGPFDAACRLLDRYAMADPAIVRAAFHADAPLPGRDMMLEGRFLGLRFPLGVRIGEVVDRDRTLGGRLVRVRGWGYRTLEAHLERGQMDWEIWKWHDTGAVEFRLHAVSQAAPIANPVVRLGFRLFGRRTQLRFVHQVLARMNQLVAEACGVEPATGGCVEVPAVGATVEVRNPGP